MMAATLNLLLLLLHLALMPSVYSKTPKAGAGNRLPEPSVQTCAAALLPPNNVVKPKDLAAAQYINLQAPINCSGNLTGYYYYYLYDGDPVVDGTISMWVPLAGGASFRQVENSQYVIDGSTRGRSGRRRRKRMPKNNVPMANEMNLPQPIPIVRGSVVGVDIANNNDRDGHYIADTDRESDWLCQLPSSITNMTNCSVRTTQLVLLVQPLVSAINCEPPHPPSNGNVSGSQYQYGDTVTYTCHEGFILVGDSYQTCQANSTWSGSVPKCILASPSPTISSIAVSSTSPLVLPASSPIIITSNGVTTGVGITMTITTIPFSDISGVGSSTSSVGTSTTIPNTSYTDTASVSTSSTITATSYIHHPANIISGITITAQTGRSTKLGTSPTPVFAVTVAPDEVNSHSNLLLTIVGSVLCVLVLAAVIVVICVVVIVRKKRRKPIQPSSKKWFFGAISNPTMYSAMLNSQEFSQPSDDGNITPFGEYAIISDVGSLDSRKSTQYSHLEHHLGRCATHDSVATNLSEMPSADEIPYSSLALSEVSFSFLRSTQLSYGSGDARLPPHYETAYSQNLHENPDTSLYQTPPKIEREIYIQLEEIRVRKIDKDSIKIVGHLGSGQFGHVEKALWTRKDGKEVWVAVKALQPGASETEKIKLLQEAATMGQFKHINVLALCGIIPDEESPMLIVEFMERGDLRYILMQARPDPGQLVPPQTTEKLLEYCNQISQGMMYLSAKGFVHRDLAARNILVSNDGICKIADFGMSRDLDEENYYIAQAGGKVPIKWTAPEALYYRKYSTASDVWSYGCVMYEIWSLGHKPFEELTNPQALRKVESGFRLPPPPGCSSRIYELMIWCWHPDPHLRPSFDDVIMILGDDSTILNIPEDALTSHPQAGILGAPLEAGHNMYCSMQKTYLK